MISSHSTGVPRRRKSLFMITQQIFKIPWNKKNLVHVIFLEFHNGAVRKIIKLAENWNERVIFLFWNYSAAKTWISFFLSEWSYFVAEYLCGKKENCFWHTYHSNGARIYGETKFFLPSGRLIVLCLIFFVGKLLLLRSPWWTCVKQDVFMEQSQNGDWDVLQPSSIIFFYFPCAHRSRQSLPQKKNMPETHSPFCDTRW